MRVLLFVIMMLLPSALRSQCEMVNTAFNAGETLTYDLYFNWKFVWVKVGSATMVTKGHVYGGIKGYSCSLLTRGNKRADKLFVMRDTLTSIVTEGLVPLYYRKGAEEGKQYRVDEVWYSYPDGVSTVRQRYQNPKGKVSWTTNRDDKDCIQDMISMFLRARSFDASRFTTGQRLHFKMADGDSVDDEVLVYRGRKNFTMKNTKVTYRCLVLSFVEVNSKGKDEEVITFYVTDDANHLPVRLDLNLNFGSAKAFLSSHAGLRNRMNSVVKKQD